jgi:phosphatidylglycerophosphatase A
MNSKATQPSTTCLKRVWSDPVHWLAFAGGAGCVPRAPGTAGTLVAIPLYLVAVQLPLIYFIGLTAVMFIVGVGICDRCSRDLGVHDHPGIVWDEVVGYFVTMLAAPTGWLWWLLGFALFRLFDIWKPWPIRQLDARVSGGFGIMLDDVVAGLFALASLQLVVWLMF